MKKRICVGIPCYDGVSAETLDDYMRFMFYVGRHYTEYDFFLSIKSKSEQFRARNSIVESAMQMGCDYLLMLDDDHVLDWKECPVYEPNTERGAYEFLRVLLEHMQTQEKAAIVGALYYHRGGDCRPVIMKEGKTGGYYWMRDDEITNELQEVAVTGGGCMLVDMNLFSRIGQPWFEPEFELGTDLQICKKAAEEGLKVYCDTSLIIGHVLSRREVVSPKTRHRLISESTEVSKSYEGMDRDWENNSAITLYRLDVEEYLGLNPDQIIALSGDYSMEDMDDFDSHIEYYASKGKEQLARQYWFHSTPFMREELKSILSFINAAQDGYGCDYGCGSSPIGFELALRGQQMDFIDIDGSGAYEFTKWRAKHRNIDCGWELKGPYDYVLLMDSIEHISDWEGLLEQVIAALKTDGAIITNYFRNMDFENKEHVSMDHAAVMQFMKDRGVYPLNQTVWMKRDLDFMTKKEGTG